MFKNTGSTPCWVVGGQCIGHDKTSKVDSVCVELQERQTSFSKKS
jgi:hypothetical protein